MTTYLLSWDEGDWPHEKLLTVIDAFNHNKDIANRWSCGNTKRIIKNDRVFLIKRGKGDRGIFGSGYVVQEPYPDIHYNADKASNREMALFVDVKFDYLVDPERTIVIRRNELDAPELTGQFWNSQGSGKTIPEKIAKELEVVWVRRTGKTGIEYPDEVQESQTYVEGSTQQVTINKYERDPRARQECLNHYGHNCVVCSFHFELSYGSIGKGYIHVHHLIPPSNIGKEYKVDPRKDLRPVCPNCHAMLHQSSIPEGGDGIDELRRKFELYER